MTINRHLHQKIVEVIAPMLGDANLRAGILQEAFVGTGIRQSIEWTGNPKVIASNLVDRLIDYGEIDGGKPALTTFLQTAVIFAGTETRSNLFALLTELESTEANNSSLSEPDEKRHEQVLLAPASMISESEIKLDYDSNPQPQDTVSFDSSEHTDERSTLVIDKIVCRSCGKVNDVSNKYCVKCYTGLKNYSNRSTNFETITQSSINQRSTHRTKPQRSSILRLRFKDIKEQISLDLNLYPSVIIFGRHDDNFSPDFDLTPYGGREKGVSRKHLSLVWQDDTLNVIDLNSANGTWLNRDTLLPHQPYKIRGGDTLTLGKLIFIVYVDNPD